MAEVTLRGVSKVYAEGTHAVADVDLDVHDGELLVLVGPSGCGKSTLLRIIAGLEAETAGTVSIGGRVVNGLSPAKRDIAMVFQNYALYPHMTARRNMELGLKLAHIPKPERQRRVREAAAILGLTDLLERRPAQLSGGQRQRVAMGRALVRHPAVFLLDEPLSNLDAKLRTQVRAEISELQRNLGTTMVFVTHDQVEAMTMADRIAVLRRGHLQQVGPAQELYDRPANLFVADFIGSPAMNLLQGRLERDGQATVLVAGAYRVSLPPATAGRPAPLQDVIAGVRPESLELASAEADGGIAGQVRLVESLGGESLVHVEVDLPPVVTSEVVEISADADEGAAPLVPTRRARFVAKVAGPPPVRVGDPVTLRIARAGRVHLFDPATSVTIDPGPAAPGAGASTAAEPIRQVVITP